MVTTRNQQPRYRRLATILRRQIVAGRWQAGDTLPTEMALCSEHGVSRHTVREALRLLAADHLIERRQGAGSIVTAGRAPVFVQPTGDFDSILQYARDAAFSLVQHGDAEPARLSRLDLSGDYRWFRGLRGVAGDAPIAVTTIFVASALAPEPAQLAAIDCSFSEWIETRFPVRVESVEQRIEAVALERPDAALLGVAAATPGLLTRRRYRAADDHVLLLSESVHPAGRFAYTTTMQRQR